MSDLVINDAEATKYLGACIAKYLQSCSSLWLQGTLGAGKTTLCQGLARALGCNQVIKSPTYTLLESYPIGELQFNHFDFYRVSDPTELELIGIRDYFTNNAICAIEWPEHAASVLLTPTLIIELEVAGLSRRARLESTMDFPIDKVIKDFSLE